MSKQNWQVTLGFHIIVPVDSFAQICPRYLKMCSKVIIMMMMMMIIIIVIVIIIIIIIIITIIIIIIVITVSHQVALSLIY